MKGRSRQSTIIDEAIIKELINYIRARQFLWNPDDESYRDKYKTTSAWREIAKMLQIPEHSARSKWKNLRDIFKREVRKFRVTSLDDYNGHWRHFESLWFLYRPGESIYNNDELEVDDKETYIIKVNPQEEKQVYADTLDTLSDKLRDDDDFEDHVETPAKRTRVDDDDYDMMFLKSLAPYFRALGPVKKLVVRNKIQEILLEEMGSQS